MFYPSGIFRLKARTALKGHWQTALLVALIVNLPTLLMQGFSAYTGNDLVSRLQAVMVTASRDGLLTQDLLFNEFDAIMGSTSFWTVRGLEVLAWLMTPCLTLGMYKWVLDRLRGQDDPVSTVLSRALSAASAIIVFFIVITPFSFKCFRITDWLTGCLQLHYSMFPNEMVQNYRFVIAG